MIVRNVKPVIAVRTNEDGFGDVVSDAVVDFLRATRVVVVEQVVLGALDALVIHSAPDVTVEEVGHTWHTYVFVVQVELHPTKHTGILLDLGKNFAVWDGGGVFFAAGVVFHQVVAFETNGALFVLFGFKFEAVLNAVHGVLGRLGLFETLLPVR